MVLWQQTSISFHVLHKYLTVDATILHGLTCLYDLWHSCSYVWGRGLDTWLDGWVILVPSTLVASALLVIHTRHYRQIKTEQEIDQISGISSKSHWLSHFPKPKYCFCVIEINALITRRISNYTSKNFISCVNGFILTNNSIVSRLKNIQLHRFD